VEVVLSVGALAVFIWTLRWMLPRALRERDPLAVACAVLIALLTLAGLLLIGVPVGSSRLG
jgi:hypothetical protein